MSATTSITEAEWHLMKILWDRPTEWLAAADIVEPVSRARGIHHRTARTLLARLVKKGAVDAKADGSANLYKAHVSRDAVIRSESKTFLSRVFDGNAAPALVHLLTESRGKLSAAQLKHLRDLLNGKESP